MYSTEPRGGLLVATNLRDAKYFESLLDSFATTSWREDENLHLLSIDNHLFREPQYLKGRIKKYINRNNKFRYQVFIYREKQKGSDFIDDQGRWDIAYYGFDKSVITRKIRQYLRMMRLDWFSKRSDLLHHSWLRGVITEEDAERWIQQFSELNNHEWVGENLLKALSFWPESQIIDALSINSDGIEQFDEICLSTDKPGKSADVLRNLVSKHLRQLPNQQSIPKISEPAQSLSNPEINSILWVEDFLLSGTEASSLITSLLGEAPQGRAPKTTPLKNSEILIKKNLQLRYALSTDFGYKILEQLFVKHGLTNAEVKYKEKIRVLTTAGEIALDNGSLFKDAEKKLINNPEKNLLLPAFQDERIWESPTRRTMAISFCRKIGKQLFQNYINHQMETIGWSAWPPERVDQSALGMKHLGLVLAFAHTVPKATLPLFWWSGPVSIQTRSRYRKKINWKPLFPKTD